MGLLAELAQRYGTDKYPFYTAFYEVLLGTRRRFDIQSVLEIGIGTREAMKHVNGYKPGASLRMWRDYFPSAEIIGIDKDASVLFIEDRIRTICLDQTKIRTAVDQLGYFDLIVDDGSHVTAEQADTAIALMPKMNHKGLYVIEDVNEPAKLFEMLPFIDAMIQTHVSGLKDFGSLAIIQAQ